MNLDYLKVSPATITCDSPEAIYHRYFYDENYIKYFSKVLSSTKELIETKFNGVSVMLYGRIKAKSSYLKKSVLKNNNVFDIYGFKIILNIVLFLNYI